jgi:predicted lipoprotein with Yx(FWY)xxD motif
MEVQMKALRFATFGFVGLLVACGGSPATTAASSPSPVATVVVVSKTDAAHGTFLVAASNQMALYTFAKDTPGVSNCSGGCLKNWPALSVTSGTAIAAGPGIKGQLSTISRADGATQVTYNGMPLYFFIKDVAVGDVTGAAIANWALAKP